MGTGEDSRRRRWLIQLLTVLAADAADQLAWGAEHEVMTDAIVLDFDLVLRLAESLDPEVAPGLRAIDLVFDEMNVRDHAGRWVDTLAADSRWDAVRTTSRRTLVRMLGEWHQPLPTRVLR
ncbi:hypothetical protein [Kitasatospora sp. NPDC089509]|uniref:hypothetical protein n=1 Tax=Kitasatospora sp. NPDC089509 TaxID=3364079 RepID=UPI0037FBAF2A